MKDEPQQKQQSYQKWGKEVMDEGFTILPAILFRGQQRLGLNPTQMMVLVQLADYWWDKQRNPHPAMKTIAERLSMSRRQLQRHMKDLEDAGLLKRIERTAQHKGKMSNEFDLSGLVDRLKKLAPEFKNMREENKSNKERVTKPRGNRQPLQQTGSSA